MAINPGIMSSASPDWHTPPDLVADVILILGTIDLDPAADDDHKIPARRHYDQAADGLARPWDYDGIPARVYLNPPYGRAIGGWTEKLRAEYHAGRVVEAVALVPGRIDTKWFRTMARFWRCEIAGRLRFSDAGPAPFPSVLFYLGPDPYRFLSIAPRWGDVYGPAVIRKGIARYG